MTPAQRKKPNGTGRFGRNEAGIAAVEFALIAPILLLLYLGATDLTQALAIDRKLGTFASTVSDLVAQEETLNSAKIAGLSDAGLAIMRPFSADDTDLRLTVFDLSGTAPEVTCDWATPDAPSAGELPDEMLALADGRFVVLASARYNYQPMFATIFNATMPLEQRSFHIARQDVSSFGCNGGGGSSGGGGSATPPPDAGEDDEEPGSPPPDEDDDDDDDRPGGGNWWENVCERWPRFC